MLRAILAAALALVALASAADPAFARHRALVSGCSEVDAMRGLCLGRSRPMARAERPAVARHALNRNARHLAASAPRAPGRASLGIGGASQVSSRIASAQILAHPAGCPARAFCGCGAAVRLFGRPVRELWLAANWFRFPRAAPGAGMAAVRRHHVFVLEQHLGGDVWLAYDANSGGHATRLHARSIAGYVIVNPRGAV